MIHININNPKNAKQIEDVYTVQIKKAMKTGIIECLRNVTIATPVDTGRARWSWFLSISVKSDELPPEGKYKTPTISEKSKPLTGYFTIDDTLYLTNNVPYITDLNNGTSKQAPARFVEMAVNVAQQAVLKYLRQPNSYTIASQEFKTTIKSYKTAAMEAKKNK